MRFADALGNFQRHLFLRRHGLGVVPCLIDFAGLDEILHRLSVPARGFVVTFPLHGRWWLLGLGVRNGVDTASYNLQARWLG